jgi:hypothetical protein|tara:strand:- start:1898 stop:2086 length:189 start_codon:yes stop_codon:yes gene_type:complete
MTSVNVTTTKNTVTVTEGNTSVVTVTTAGPQGPAGADGADGADGAGGGLSRAQTTAIALIFS